MMTQQQVTRDVRSHFEIERLRGDRFDHYWPHIKDMLVAVPHTWQEHTLESIYERTHNTSIQVWSVGDADKVTMVLFTQVACHASGKILEIFWGCGTGTFEAAGDVVEAAMEQFAQQMDCGEIQVRGRPGWEKALAPRGFKRVAVILTRKVKNPRLQ